MDKFLNIFIRLYQQKSPFHIECMFIFSALSYRLNDALKLDHRYIITKKIHIRFFE